jgi:hypothetical protein
VEGIILSATIPIAELSTLREAGYDEYWLQQQIVDNPACLGLGDLEAIGKERRQASGGRLDILLKDPADDTMYEVEVMLGETDETHIIRTIEYWDNEKRIWPLRQHFAVLVAERINRRFFNVIHLISHSIPIIAIQTSLLTANGTKSLFFSKILDTYEEVDDGTSLDDKIYNRDYWSTRAHWTLDTADVLFSLTQRVFEGSINYLKSYIAITSGGNNLFRLHKRSLNKSLLIFRIANSLQDRVASLLDSKNITHVRRPKGFAIVIDKALIEANTDVFNEIASLLKSDGEAS